MICILLDTEENVFYPMEDKSEVKIGDYILKTEYKDGDYEIKMKWLNNILLHCKMKVRYAE